MVALVGAIQNNESNESDPNSDFSETNWTLPMLSPCGAQRPPETYEPAGAHDPGPASLGGPSDQQNLREPFYPNLETSVPKRFQKHLNSVIPRLLKLPS